MRTILLLLTACAVMAFTPVNQEVVSELQRITQAYQSYLKYEVQMDLRVVDSAGNTVTQQQVRTARENECYFTQGDNMEMYGGAQGAFLVNTPSKRVFFDEYTRYTDSSSYADNALRSAQLASRIVLIKGAEGSNRIEFYYDEPIEGLSKMELTYNQQSLRIEGIRLHTTNITENPWEPIKGFVSIRYQYQPLKRDISNKYKYLLQQVGKGQPKLEGAFHGYTLMN